VVWIGVVGVVPQEGCELLAPHEGAFVNFLTLASSDSEYRAKVSGALSSYSLDPRNLKMCGLCRYPIAPLKRFCQSRRVRGEQESETRPICAVPHLSPRDVIGMEYLLQTVSTLSQVPPSRNPAEKEGQWRDLR
jgi:hypothetical protein